MKTVEYLLTHTDELLSKIPFFRGNTSPGVDDEMDGEVYATATKLRVNTPRVEKKVVSQERFLRELDPECHDVMFDANIPSICVKLENGNFHELQFKRMGLPYQIRLREKQTLCLCGNPTVFTLRGATPSDRDKANFDLIKEYWTDRNMDGMRTKAVYTQKGVGDCGLLFYYNRKGEVRCRLISYEDGYVIISHNDDNGDRMLEVIYYRDEDNNECIDCYDDRYLYRLRGNKQGGWNIESVEHGFSEIPLVTKRGDVAWNNVQSLIEIYELIYNVFIVIQKRHGWGILYIQGKFKEQAKKIAGSIILNDTSIDGKGSAEFKAPPSPQGMIDTLNSIQEEIQKGASTTFLLPKDVKSSGDISALAIMLTQSLDIEGANKAVIDWQNFMSKMQRLFVEGLAKELVNKGINENAITEFRKLRISATLKVWRPFNETEYNQMLATLKGAGLLSTKTGIEKNTVSAPDELARVQAELDEALKQEKEKAKFEAELKASTATSTSPTQQTNGGNGNE